MRILFLTQVLPYPLDAGPKTRAYYVLRHFAAAGHIVTLLSFVRTGDRSEYVDYLRQFCHAVCTVPITRSQRADVAYLLRSLPTTIPFLIARDWRPALANQIEELLQTGAFDAIHADQLWMAPYALHGAAVARRTARAQPQLVLDQHNAVFQIPRRLAAGERNPARRLFLHIEARKLAAYERRTVARFDQVVWVTAEDWDAVLGEDVAVPRPGAPQHTVIPICIDPAATRVVQRNPDARRVTFLGGMHWPPNATGILWFAREVWPLVLAQCPDARLTVIGKDPPPALANLQSPIPNLDAPGYVADLAPYLAETAVFIVPLHAGGGMRVKILDAWGWGLPVVSTSLGAEGLATRDGENICLADGAAGFAKAVAQVVNERVLARHLAGGGRRTVEDEYDWRKVYAAWNDIYP